MSLNRAQTLTTQRLLEIMMPIALQQEVQGLPDYDKKKRHPIDNKHSIQPLHQAHQHHQPRPPLHLPAARGHRR